MAEQKIIQQEGQIAKLEDYRAWEDVFTTWLKNYKSENTRKKYREIVEEFFKWVDKWFTDVEKLDVIDWRDYLEHDREIARQAKDGSSHYAKARLSDTSVNLYLSALSSFYSFAKERGLVESNPTDDVKRNPINPYGKATYLNIEKGQDLQLLRGIETDTEKGLRDKAIVLLMLTTAIRVGAVSDATVGDIMDLNGQWYLMYRNKGGERQTALLTSPVIKAIRAYLAARGTVAESDPLFATVIGNSINPKKEAGKRLSGTAITNMVARRAKKVGLHHITAHSLRHSAAVQAIQHGSVGDVQKLLKHKSNRVTLIYIDHIEDNKADEMTEKLASRYE
jgi:integrase/recombinase XerC